MPEPMPLGRRVLYGLGSAGWQLTDRVVVSIALFYYLPPAGRGLREQIPSRVFLGVVTAYGIASLFGRVVDAIADPIVGFACDRSRSRFGRRRSFLIYGIVPMVGLPILLFWPPGSPGSTLNAVWLTLLSALYFAAFTVYVGPYLALMPEIARNAEERVNLSMVLAAAGLPASLFGGVWGLGMDWGRGLGLDPEASIRAIVLVASGLAFALCLLPIAAVDEARYCAVTRSDLGLVDAFRATLQNRPFRRYLLAQLPFIVGINMIQPAMIYYATVVLGRSEGYTAPLGAAVLGATLLAFAPVNVVARRIGPKATILFCVACLGLALAALGLLRPDLPGGPSDAHNLWIVYGVMAAMGPALAGFMTMPNVLVGQVVDYDTARTGAHRAAMYFGVQGFATKALYGVSGAILAYLFSAFGNSREEPLGVMLVGPVAGAFCVLSALLFLRYPEAEAVAALPGADDTPPS